MLFNKLLFKLNLITEREYQQDILEYLSEAEEDTISFIDGVFIIMFLATLFTLGAAWINIM